MPVNGFQRSPLLVSSTLQSGFHTSATCFFALKYRLAKLDILIGLEFDLLTSGLVHAEVLPCTVCGYKAGVGNNNNNNNTNNLMQYICQTGSVTFSSVCIMHSIAVRVTQTKQGHRRYQTSPAVCNLSLHARRCMTSPIRNSLSYYACRHMFSPNVALSSSGVVAAHSCNLVWLILSYIWGEKKLK